MPNKRPSVKNEKQYEKLKDKGMSKERAARIANSPGASSRGGRKSGSGARSSSSQGGTTAQKKAGGARAVGPPHASAVRRARSGATRARSRRYECAVPTRTPGTR